MILGLLRHGIAEEAGERTGHRDEPRRLTDDGRQRIAREARGIRHLDLEIDRVLTSPLIRCEETAQIVADACGWEVRNDQRLRPGLDVDTLFDVLLEYPDARGLIVCGHQPDMAQLVGDLIGGGDVEFKKGAMAIVELADMRPRGGILRGHYPPQMLRRLGGTVGDDG